MYVVTVGLFSNFVCLTIFHIKNNFCYIVLKIILYTFYILSNLKFSNTMLYLLPLLLLSHFSHVRLCVTPQTAAHQAPPSLGFSRQEDWSGLPFPSPIHESEKWKWSRSVVSDPQRPHGLQPTRLLCPWDFPGKSPDHSCCAKCGILAIKCGILATNKASAIRYIAIDLENAVFPIPI